MPSPEFISHLCVPYSKSFPPPAFFPHLTTEINKRVEIYLIHPLGPQGLFWHKLYLYLVEEGRIVFNISVIIPWCLVQVKKLLQVSLTFIWPYNALSLPFSVLCAAILLILYRQNTKSFTLHFEQFCYNLEQLRKANNCSFYNTT